MDLTDRAIAEYRKEQKLIEDENARTAEAFADKAAYALQDIIDVRRADMIITDKRPYSTSFIVGDVSFQVSASEDYCVVNMIRRCSLCGSDVMSKVLNLKDIGKMLVEPHNKYDCDRVVEMKKKEEGVGIMTSEERLLEALKDFIAENDHM